MARIPLVTRNDVPEEKGAYDAFMQSPSNRPNVGPRVAPAHAGDGTTAEALRTYIRGEASLPQKLQELVMITVAREMDCAFIWYAPRRCGTPGRGAGRYCG